jgi:signal transduction histidine kinase
MRRLIESLLQLARLDAGQETMRRIQFDLARTVSESVELIRPLAEERRITIRTELGAANCLGDPERVSQVVLNLLTNALQHNKDGGEVCVKTHNGNGNAVLTVADNGPGIPAEHLPNVFKRFYRADAARTSSQGRSGLGLAISSAIVNAHGGSIEIESKVGEGSAFTMRLPVS